MTVPAPIVVVGAGLGGLRVVEAIRRAGSDAPIVVIGDEFHLPYNRTPLSKGPIHDASREDLAFPLRPLIADVTWRTGTRAVDVDLDDRSVVDSTGQSTEYAALVIASGVRPRRLALGHQDDDLPGRTALRTLDHASHINAMTRSPVRVVVAGGGFVGCEVAATLRARGCDVVVVSAARHPLERALGAPLASDVQDRHEQRGIRFLSGTSIVRVERRGERITHAVTSDGDRLPCDLLIEAIGSTPNTEWLGGTSLDITHGVRTDNALRAVGGDGHPQERVFAVGDVAAFPHPLFEGEARPIEHWSIPTDTGQRAGKVVAAVLSGDDELTARTLDEAFAPTPTFWSDQGNIHLLAFGLPSLGEPRLLLGERGADCVYGYFRDEHLIGACGIGFRGQLQAYRKQIAAAWE